MTNDELVAVMVPRAHLVRVYGLIARLERRAKRPGPGAGKNCHGTDAGEWNTARLNKVLQQTPPAMKDLLSVMARHPDQWLTTEQLAQAIQNNAAADWKTVAGTMGAFRRRVKNRYGLQSLPFEKRFDHVSRTKVYRMSGEMAGTFNELLRDL